MKQHLENHRGTDRKRRNERPLYVCVSVVFLFQFIALLYLSGAAAHEPITTRVRFNKEVIRILERSCLGCHRPGGVAMSLVTYDEARPWAKAIKEELLEKRMPPWHAVKGYGEFRNAPLLTQREIDMIVNWVEGGAPKGDDKDLPARPLYSDDWALGKPDLVLKPDGAVRVAGDADEYRSFELATRLKEERWLTAIDLQPGVRSVVHCATFYLVRGDKKAADSTSVLGTFTPGLRVVSLPDAVAQLIPTGSRIGLRIHYKGAGDEARDLSAIGLYFSKAAPTKLVSEVPVAIAGEVIPAGARLHPVKAGFTVEADAEAVAIRPRAHPLVVSFQATAYRPDGTEEVLIWTRGYRFDWQPTYYFKQPVPLPKGTRVEVVAYFDNSEGNQNNVNDPPRQVRWSDLTPDPLCSLAIARPRNGND